MEEKKAENSTLKRILTLLGIHFAGGILFWIVSNRFGMAVFYWFFMTVVYGCQWLGAHPAKNLVGHEEPADKEQKKDDDSKA